MSSKENEKRPDLNVIVELLDNEGYTNKELAEKTDDFESHVSKYVKKLRTARIVHREDDDGDLNVYIGPKENAKPEEKLNAFKYILKSFFEEPRWDATQQLDTTRKLLASKYVDSLITTCGLKPIYEIFEEYMKKEEFRSIASQTLLSQPALIEEYMNYPEILKERPEVALGLKINHDLCSEDLIAVLLNFDPINAVEFYRKIFNDTFSKLYREVTDSDAMKEFTDYDVLLSPFTSYPINNPADLILQRPFERIYADAYILNEMDYNNFIKRAYVIYSHFAEILSKGIDILRLNEIVQDDRPGRAMMVPEGATEEEFKRYSKDVKSYVDCRAAYLMDIKDHIEIPVKLSIYYWNIASYRFDLVRYFLKRTGSYHILSDNGVIRIIDLKTGKSCLSPKTQMELMSSIPLLPGPKDPFAGLRACDAFHELKLETREVKYDEILGVVKSSLSYL